MTKAEQIRMGVAKMSDAGESVKNIALVLGLSEDRVEEILDLLDRNEGLPHLDDGQRAPLVEPLLGSSVLQANAPKQQMCRVCGGVDGEHDADQHRDQKAAAKPAARSEVATTATMPGRVVAAPQRKPVVQVRPVPAAEKIELAIQEVGEAISPKPAPEHGTVQAYKRHYSQKEKPCQLCKDAYNADERRKTAEKRAAAGEHPVGETPCGTDAAYQRHQRRKEAPCTACEDAHRVANTKRVAKSREQRDVELAQAIRKVPPAPVDFGLARGGIVKPRVQIRWMVPRGEEIPHGTKVEYEIHPPGHTGRLPRTHDSEVAERAANAGARVFRRLVTEFIEVT